MAWTIRGRTGEWELVCGLEIHAQVISKAKLFSGAATSFGAEPNTQVSPIDAGMPGMLPVLNGFCVEQAVKTGLALDAEINKVSIFERKNYFYPDLPQGYQISQYQHPIVGRGRVLLDLPDGTTKAIGITRLHLEQDAGKSLHGAREGVTLVDLNRCGVALMEIVTEPDIRAPEEAVLFLKKLRSLLRYVGTCDGNMEEGSLRCDANVSVRRLGETRLGTRCEIKNVNSMRFVAKAIEYEARRQVELLENGGIVEQETRLFDAAKGETRPMRSKEEAHDYRYFPDPDLLPLELDDALVARLRAELPELPDAKKARFVREYGLSAYDAGVLVAERAAADYFEAVARGRDPKQAANWVINELFGALAKRGLDIEACPLPPEALGELLDLLAEGRISGKIAKEVFHEAFESGARPRAIVEARGLEQVTDVGAIEPIVDKLLADNPAQVANARKNPKVVGWFVGQVMKATGGRANPELVNDLLRKKLGLG
ncbi:MAG: Asp-tRNA(Asn)/Glu-tRNA(Gln) amidotransferase subunit GatB [Geminicoccaceae bacterium]|nr:Asp-tRNA(Asn)/Glu-tRNA(Gln) amidotransferase subunit GatB [Geminicoccaceae bacterium]MCS7267721.1 Asp-tRNA(Asn)/Glu-tRNA(Gln) amidotransferase subunit GatB [Geminicoccaceae bacterium]MCX7629354.1 Asp-tRNA(Asn)/Glu-tRNA(Gln) amidotransferase subunit GatB [Geminicoccaceae bacterium]MDW8123564.1 Asp-tRNA(Asn)/Glu-tRNA(Gln) amidotransferase subunit GatB [Geminicoccaceae bacterium]MDW8339905.1 Asp-tRNA(Asn)/Glu-tRNA(Gln) amidotransferase subunit GatB [Geminicoccaceae bacterium]